MNLQLIGADPLGGPAIIWLDTDTGDVVIKGLTADPTDLRHPDFPGTSAVELPDRMKPILLQAIEAAEALGFS